MLGLKLNHVSKSGPRALLGNDDLVYVYYDPTVAEGYIEFNGVNALTDVEIMILL